MANYPEGCSGGMTRVPEQLAQGLTVAFGQDCVMDPWYSLGSGDMLEVASMGLHVAQMTSQAAMRQCFDAVTINAAKILQLPAYGLAPGCHADFVLLQARICSARARRAESSRSCRLVWSHCNGTETLIDTMFE